VIFAQELFKNSGVPMSHLPPSLSRPIAGVTSDSRAVKPGFVFVAVRGVSQDGHQFIATAVEAGAALVVGEQPQAALKVPYVLVPDSALVLARLAANFQGNPSHGMLMVGVTGTSGKTTTTYLIESMLTAAGHKTGLIGTVEIRYPGGKTSPATHTTPGAAELQSSLAEMKRAGCTAVVMEVSSHALKQQRSACIAFDAVVFTNLTREHLDFHPDMEDYYASKRRLFTEYANYSHEAGKKPVAAINIEDEYGSRLSKESSFKVFSYGVGPEGLPESLEVATVSGAKLEIGLNGIRGDVSGVLVHSPLVARFNASNLLGAIAVGKGLGLPDAKVGEGISKVTVPGRLERVPNRAGIHVLVDYAHKSDALEKVLLALQGVRGQHRLITVFGCGGDRDRLKRPVMGKIAVTLSDQVWVTSDNPRTENPDAIIEEIIRGLPQTARKGENYRVEPDRRSAIEGAIAMAKAGDLVLIAGKGHEDYQIISDPSQPSKTRKIHFDDREVAALALAKHA
jgi:UDP-N-acetylmuramoyl-L-alanyl-D-glutamate--2,6-diaminopimelate ligase